MLMKYFNKIDFVKGGSEICFQLQLDCIETSNVNHRLCDYVTVESQRIMKLALFTAYREREG